LAQHQPRFSPTEIRCNSNEYASQISVSKLSSPMTPTIFLHNTFAGSMDMVALHDDNRQSANQ
jgi:hypothetical protein